jgi:hypothetical protein
MVQRCVRLRRVLDQSPVARCRREWELERLADVDPHLEALPV